MSGVEHRIRREIVGGVRGLFNDQGNGEQPVVRSTDALFEPSSPIWRVHGDVTSMMVGGISALLLQMLHPAVLAGVWDHSNFRTDMNWSLAPHGPVRGAHDLWIEAGSPRRNRPGQAGP